MFNSIVGVFADDGRDLSALKTTLVMIGKFGITGSYSALYLYGSEIFPTSIRSVSLSLGRPRDIHVTRTCYTPFVSLVGFLTSWVR